MPPCSAARRHVFGRHSPAVDTFTLLGCGHSGSGPPPGPACACCCCCCCRCSCGCCACACACGDEGCRACAAAWCCGRRKYTCISWRTQSGSSVRPAARSSRPRCSVTLRRVCGGGGEWGGLAPAPPARSRADAAACSRAHGRCCTPRHERGRRSPRTHHARLALVSEAPTVKRGASRKSSSSTRRSVRLLPRRAQSAAAGSSLLKCPSAIPAGGRARRRLPAPATLRCAGGGAGAGSGVRVARTRC